MTIADLIKAEIDSIPEELQLLLLDFIELLKKRYPSLKSDNRDLELTDKIDEESFIGMWKDREDMKNSSEWVREIRKQEW
ncbi:DUF2281 domain-containing protein [Cyanobacterium sp. Dongsha4]|uniref:DUF2281 domain-containing protein n=1 Tax=Cyanobacterium sp. DS4 TaxID=2878255 RepID=UPI002E816494|nr:DUF2281 domain-containing protein [Cyanobacterium sp. Dongsha4]WVL01294.1 DUF2281 domain-containing protein [Cyanobacterium sp. Dongsha4]